jgi:hypothetical protein
MNREHRLSKDKPYPSVGDVNFPKVVREAAIESDEPESENVVDFLPQSMQDYIDPVETSTAIVLFEPPPQLANLEAARQTLAECRTLSEVKKIRDIAEAVRVYVRAAHLGRESQNYAAEISLEASRRAGEILKQLERGKTGPKELPASVADNSEYAQTLKDTQTPERTAQHWQTLTDIPEETFTDYIQQSKDLKTEITQAGLLKAAKTAANRKYPTPVNPPEKPQISAADITARLTVLLSELSVLNAFTKRLKYADLDEPSKAELQTLITQLRKVSKDAAERADRLQAVAS